MMADAMLTLIAAAASMVTLASSQSASTADLLLRMGGPSTTCDGDAKKILCLPPNYSKFDLPYMNDFNIIDIGKSTTCLLRRFGLIKSMLH